MSPKGFSLELFHSSPLDASVDEGAVDAALKREELSVVDAVFVLEAPLPRLPLIMPSNILSSL
jgi:hypothetical protein